MTLMRGLPADLELEGLSGFKIAHVHAPTLASDPLDSQDPERSPVEGDPRSDRRRARQPELLQHLEEASV